MLCLEMGAFLNDTRILHHSKIWLTTVADCASSVRVLSGGKVLL